MTTQRMLQGFWRGMLPSLIMVSNPTVNYMLYENFTTSLMNFRRRKAGGACPPNKGGFRVQGTNARLHCIVEPAA